ncbi:MAG: sugar transferase [Candidatus Paceibacterota bacterium]|nr:MAG: sugar transferase [Candidatus Paceibacterota bacterium]
MKRSDLILNVARVPVDMGMLFLAGVLTYVLRTNILDTFRPVLFELRLPLDKYIALVIPTSLFFIACYAVAGLYTMGVRMSRAEECAKVALASSAGILGVIVFIFVSRELFDSRFLVLGAWILAIICVCAGRLFIRWMHGHLMRRGFGIHRLLVIGHDVVTERLIAAIKAQSDLGYVVARHMQVPDMNIIGDAWRSDAIDGVLLAQPTFDAPTIVELVEYCHEHHIPFTFVPNMHETLTTHYSVDAIGDIPVIELKRTSLDGWGRVFKRVFDLCATSLGLLILSPLFAAIALAITWETRGPVFVRLARVSKNREFYLLKFRSMIENAEELKPLLLPFNERADGPLFKMTNDPRVTHVGRWLRRLRLDELPQLWNVLRGDISLVGPRPHQPDEVARYQRHHKRVLGIKAGVTGFAQISGSSTLSFEEEVRLDTFYIENWSFWMDVRIIVRTLMRLVSDRTAV